MSDLYDLSNNPYAISTYGGYQGTIGTVDNTSDVGHRSKTVYADSDEANNTLSFQDMLMLLVTQLQNQTIDNTMDTSDMMNQIIQMTVMQALTDVKSKVDDLTEANVMSYAASLVGQTVTVGILDNKGNLVGERVGVVTGTGIYNGQRVIFIGDECYLLNQIMAVGTLPKDKTDDSTDSTEPGEVPGDDFDSDYGVANPDDKDTEGVDPDDGANGADPDDSTTENAGAGAAEALG